MKVNISEVLSKNMKDNLGVFFTVILFFSIGIAAGTFTVKALDNTQKQDILMYLNRFFQVLDKEQVKNTTVLLQSLKNNFQTIALMWILSITIIGVPITLFIISFRGFIVGFTIAILIQGLGWKGVLFTMVAVLPQNLIYIPILIIISALSLSFSLHVIMKKFKKMSMNNTKISMLSYTVTVCMLFAVMCIGSVIEAYLSPLLIKSMSAYMIIQ